MENKKGLSTEKPALPDNWREELTRTLKVRFENNMDRHIGIEWDVLQAKLEANTEKLWSLNEMERTGGEPDVVCLVEQMEHLSISDLGYTFFDCSPETPKGRRSVCYDRQGLESRKENKPENNAIDMATAMGIELLTEQQYRELSRVLGGNLDTKTSSWLKTPSGIRKLGGAIFADYRYGRVFVYHNGAESYFGARGFRGSLKI
jgi:hypothetical protein